MSDGPCIDLFFFQAEDGIRGAQESRELGDVYKRQHRFCPTMTAGRRSSQLKAVSSILLPVFIPGMSISVSYTHLTLPTIYSV